MGVRLRRTTEPISQRPDVEYWVEAHPSTRQERLVPRPALLAAIAAAAIAVAGLVSAGSASVAPAPGPPSMVLQMNLCLSGKAGCFARTAYPSVVNEASAAVQRRDPAAVTLNETCSGDAAEIARRTGYQLRFAAVLTHGAPLPCIDPGGRGDFGIAVLTKDDIAASHDEAFAVHADEEQRRWLCATTGGDVTVCTAHLSTRGSAAQRAANDAECRELRDVLARYQDAGTTVFGGDVNRQESCAPATMWSRQDATASQAAGIQHIYGSLSLEPPVPEVAAATYTDHDFLYADGSLGSPS
jgi:endonuclease/exonuclease/phosphatase family metal-dependent hydrolase